MISGYKQEHVMRRTVHYTGSDALYKGYAVCWNRDSTTDKDLGGTSGAATVSNWWRHLEVEKPASGNLHNLAGFVADNYLAQAGGRDIEIQVPRKHVLDVYTNANCTTQVTELCVQPGSYLLGGPGTGLTVAKAIQTVDRSSINGRVQAICDLPAAIVTPYLTASSRMFSPAIWEKCPVDQIIAGGVDGLFYFNDFLGNYVLANNKTVQHLDAGVAGFTAATAGTTISMPADEPTGVVILNSTTTQEDSGINILGGLNTAGQLLLTGRKTWIEARVKIGPDAAGKDDAAVFFGLAEEALCATTALLTVAGALTDKDYLGFLHVLADEKWDAVYNTAGGAAAVTHAADAHTSVADTYVKLGIYCDGTSVYFYVNGVQVGTALALSAAEVPDDQKMALYFVSMNVGGDTSEAAIDWVRVAQLI